MYKCKYCGREFEKRHQLIGHVAWRKENPNYDPNKKDNQLKQMRSCKGKKIKNDEICYCQYCGKECKHKNSLAQHELRCKQNPNRKVYKSNFIKYHKDIKSGLVEKKFSNQYTKAKLLGLPKPEISDETREKIAKVWRGRKHSEESKQKISASMKRVVKERPESYSASNVNGRVKKVEYNGNIFDSSWEVMVAKFLDNNNIIWERPQIGFEYFWENDIHLYYPDFYIPSMDLYIEVKGYKRDRDEYKWKSLNNLVVIRQKEINAINKGTYVLGL